MADEVEAPVEKKGGGNGMMIVLPYEHYHQFQPKTTLTDSEGEIRCLK